MEFSGKGAPISGAGMAKVCDTLDVGEPEIWAVLTVETRGFGYLPDRRPQILFERHWFSRLTNRRFDGAHPDISNRSPGGYKGGAAEYARLAQARALDEEAALKSASWGLPQIMGFNHAGAGFAFDLDVGEFILSLLQVVLHGLCLLHQAGELSFVEHGWVLRLQ